MMDWLNNYSGLFSLLAVLAAIVVPYIIYCKEKRDKKKELRHKQEAMDELNDFPMSNPDREYYTKKRFIQKELND